MTDDRLALELRALADEVFPEAPSLVEGVLSGLARPSERRRRVLVALTVAAILVGGVLLIPAPREAVARFFGIGGVTIEQVAEYELPPATATGVAFGERTQLDAVEAVVGFAPELPRLDGLTEPDVYVRSDVAGGLVTLLYDSAPGTPGLVVTEFETAGEVAIKQLEPGVSFREVVIEPETRGFWIEGGAHTIAFFGADGSLIEDSARLVGNTLVWQRDDLTFRIEAALSLDEVLDIARSIGPG